ncbi:MAG: histidine phosphatase family protein [Planctomycetota bacterium]
MVTFLLIRHAHTDAVGRRIAGRMPNVGLSPAGRAQLDALAARIGEQPVQRLLSSPLERARETAAAVARVLRIEVEFAEELNELDFGAWTGRTFAELAPDPLWQQYNAFRSGTRMPGGEVMLEVQARVVGLIQRLRETADGQAIALVTHGDVIRAALAYYLGIPLDLILRFEVDPASVSAVRLDDDGPHVLCINRTADQSL